MNQNVHQYWHVKWNGAFKALRKWFRATRARRRSRLHQMAVSGSSRKRKTRNILPHRRLLLHLKSSKFPPLQNLHLLSMSHNKTINNLHNQQRLQPTQHQWPHQTRRKGSKSPCLSHLAPPYSISNFSLFLFPKIEQSICFSLTAPHFEHGKTRQSCRAKWREREREGMEEGIQ